jgi:hypothetical protein
MRETIGEACLGGGTIRRNPGGKFGKDDPYFGVLTAEKFRKKNLDRAALSEFFASGEDHVAHIL